MSLQSMQRAARFALPLLFVVALAAGCAQPEPWGDPDSGLILTYRMPQGQALNYELDFDQAHALMAGEQIRRFGNGREFSFSMTAGDSSDDNLSLAMFIESLEISVVTPQGPLSREAKGFAGVDFGMTVSPLGEVIGFSERTEEMKYIVSGAYEQSIESDFGGLLPRLPETPLKVGDSWKSEGAVPGKTFNAETTTRLELTNTLEGFETVEGLECAKIAVAITGYLHTEGDVAPDLAVGAGDVSGDGNWYFAYKEGYVVRMKIKVQSKAQQNVGGSAMGPATVTERTTVELTLKP